MAKRKHKVRKPKPKIVKRSTKLWPIIWCTGEDICIGVSRVAVGIKILASGKRKARAKVSHTQWREWNSGFREGYEIDMSVHKNGDVVHCPKCGAKADFRVFPSLKPPEMCDVVKQDDSKDSSD